MPRYPRDHSESGKGPLSFVRILNIWWSNETSRERLLWIATLVLTLFPLLIWVIAFASDATDFNPFFNWNDRPGKYASPQPVIGSHYFGDSQELFAAQRERGLFLYFGVASYLSLIQNPSSAIITGLLLIAVIILSVQFFWFIRAKRHSYLALTVIPYLIWAIDRGQFLLIIGTYAASIMILSTTRNGTSGVSIPTVKTVIFLYVMASAKPQTAILILILVAAAKNYGRMQKVSFFIFAGCFHVLDILAILNGQHAVRMVSSGVWSDSRLLGAVNRNASLYNFVQLVGFDIGWQIIIGCVCLAVAFTWVSRSIWNVLLALSAAPLLLIPRSPLYNGLFIVAFVATLMAGEKARAWECRFVYRSGTLLMLGSSSVWFTVPTWFGAPRPLTLLTLPVTAAVCFASASMISPHFKVRARAVCEPNSQPSSMG